MNLFCVVGVTGGIAAIVDAGGFSLLLRANKRRNGWRRQLLRGGVPQLSANKSVRV